MHIHPSNKTLVRLVECQNLTEVSFIVADDWLVSADVNYSLGADSLSLSSHPQTCGVRVNILKTDLIITIK